MSELTPIEEIAACPSVLDAWIDTSDKFLIVECTGTCTLATAGKLIDPATELGFRFDQARANFLFYKRI